MTDTTDTKGRKVQPWHIRKVTYAIVAILGVVAAYFGVVSEQQVDTITASPLLATLIGVIASMFTGRGSDSTATGEDVRAAQRAAVDINAVAEAVRERVAPEVTRAANEVEKRISSYGKHSAAAPQPPAGATYPGGDDA